MLGEQINAVDGYEIAANFNSNFKNWYFGIDGNTPADKYDFVSVVLHELTHGLGFIGSFYSTNNQGGYDFPADFDQFVVNKTGQKLVDIQLFANPSVALYQNLTSGWLEFNTRLVQYALPRLYAPSVWSDGSSIYHLNENTYPTGNANSLMTYATAKGEAIHDPGPRTMAIMSYMGWKNISIRHTPLKDMEAVSTPINFDLKLISDYDLDPTQLFLIYTLSDFSVADTVSLNATAVVNSFNGWLPQTITGEIQYYFLAADIKGRVFVYPSNSPARALSFKIGMDNEAPVLIHEPIKYLLSTDLTAQIEVNATDNIGLESVVLEYFVNDGDIKTLSLQNSTTDVYTGELNLPEGSVKDGDQLSYRIVATDASNQNNRATLPLTGFFTFKIISYQDPVDRYVTDFNSDAADFISTGSEVATATGFDSLALNSAHPYLSPDTDNMNYNFSTILKYPVILKTGGIMTFDEIVLVEPGETGVTWENENFYDYVIVEGSKDGGTTWSALADGYDSNTLTSWLNLYNSSMSQGNSTAVPTKELFVKHEIDLLANGNFQAGDAILIRFRLFSDPYSNGWGWIIDNLAIQDFETAVSPSLLSSGEVLYFPNPAAESLNLQIQSKQNIHQLFLKIYNSSGKMVRNQSYSVESSLFQTQIDVSFLIPGLYLFALESGCGQLVSRKILLE